MVVTVFHLVGLSWYRTLLSAVLPFSIFRQIINTMAGDIVNKKIVDYFTTLTRWVPVPSHSFKAPSKLYL